MTENEMIEKITNIIDTTPKTDEFYYFVSRRIIREVITPRLEEMKYSYEELMLKAEARDQ